MTDQTESAQDTPAVSIASLHVGETLASGRLPDADGGVKAIVDLTREAAEIDIVTIETEGLGEGLPPIVPMLIDHRKEHGPRDIRSIVEAYRLRPARRLGTAQTATLESFVALVNRHKDEHTALFAQVDWPNPKLLAVIDYHKLDGEPRYLKHRIEYPFPVTEEFTDWINNDGALMDQAEFAIFLEEHSAELAAPYQTEVVEYEALFKEKMAAPNDVVALSRDLEVRIGARVKRQERLSSGERTIEFSEEHLNKAGEKVTIPGIFMVSIPAFVDGEAVRIPARLRYRVGGGSIKWGYQLWRWRFWLRQQVKNDMLTAAKGAGLPAYEGAPEV